MYVREVSLCERPALPLAAELPVEGSSICTLQLGMSWFPEQAGNGLDRVYYALTRYLPEVRVRVTGLVAGTAALGRTTANVRAFAPATAPLYHRWMALRQALRQVFATERPDLVAAHFALYAFPGLDLFGERPLVVHFHGPWASESRAEGAPPVVVRAKALLERVVYRRASRFIVLSNAFRDVLVSQYGAPGEGIRVVPGGVETRRFDTGLTRAEARQRLDWPADRPVVLSVRRLAHRMGLEVLLDAFKDVHRRVPEALLLIAGMGPLAEVLKTRIDVQGLERHVRLLGFVPDDVLPLAYRAADVSVVPSTALEGFGLVTAESLAAGTPVLATPVGGLPEVLRPLSPDLLFASGQPEVLADHLTAVLTGQLRLPGAHACQTYARAQFDWPVIARRTRQVYEEVLS